jgi:tetratricopeptide (TPR) repeat protein
MAPSDTAAVAALFARAVEYHNRGRLAEALTLYDSVVHAAPRNAVVHCNHAIALQAAGRLDEAICSYDRAIRCRSDYADAYFGKATALGLLQRWNEAATNYDFAIRYEPDHFAAWRNKGNTLLELQRPGEALSCFEQAVAIAPHVPTAHYDRANALFALNRLDDSAASFDRAIALKPDFADALCNRGNVLNMLQRLDDALASYDAALCADPTHAPAHYNRGKALQSLNRPEEALAGFDRAIAFQPDHADAFCNRGNALQDLKRFDEALESYDRALELRPEFAEVLCSKGMCKLILGDFAAGWPLYEWRPNTMPLGASERFSQPRWTGRENLDGMVLFIHAEQGLGDTIQFCRYALLAQEMGARVILAVNDGLMRLLGSLGPAIEIIPQKRTPSAFDAHIALMSMPLAFKTTLGTCPAEVPYLRAEPARVETWKKRLGPQGFKIGICWQGSKIDPRRSFPLVQCERVARLPDVRLISLQKKDGVEQLDNLPAGMKVETLGDDFDSDSDAFIDTAAVMECLDLVIAPDTANAHLAGALGRPVWVALKYVPDWRWMLDRSDCPWYPTMRLFRQAARGDWPGVFMSIETELRALARYKRTAE